MGRCSFFDRHGECKFEHVDNPANAKTTKTTGGQARKEKCPVCGGRGHAIDMCSKFRAYKKAGEENAKLNARIAEMAVAQTAALKAMAANVE